MRSYHSCSSDGGYSDGSSRGYSSSTGISSTHGVSETCSRRVSEGVSRPYNSGVTPTRSYCISGNPVSIARFNFEYQVRDALTVMKNVGALQTAEAREWCLLEMQRFLLELFRNDRV